MKNMKEIITVDVEKLVPGGKGLCRINDKVVFVSYVLPGEKVKISIIEEKKNYSEAQLIQILNSSDLRVEPFCPLYGRCGGCNMQHMSYSTQLEFKKQFVEEHLRRNGIVNAGDISVFSSTPQGYRNRVQVHFHEEIRGFKEKSTNQIVPVDHCPVASKGINHFLSQEKVYTGDGRISVFGTDEWYSSELIGEDIFVTLQGKKIFFNSQLFFQSNLSILPSFAEYLRRHVSGGKLLDLYCGIGLMSSLVEDMVEEIEAVELNRQVEPYLKMNIKKPVRFYPLSMEKWVKRRGEKNLRTETIILDPPRTGLSKTVRGYLASSHAQTIIYVSCDPATMTRDLKTILADNYEMKDFSLFDFYPQTSHLEAVALLKRKEL